MCGTGYISTKAGFTFYVVITFIWIFCASFEPYSLRFLTMLTSELTSPSLRAGGAFVCAVLPIWEEREAISRICGHMWADLRGKGPQKAPVVVEGP